MSVEEPPLIPVEYIPVAIIGVVAAGAFWLYMTATHCWTKPVGSMPGWCLAFGAGFK